MYDKSRNAPIETAFERVFKPNHPSNWQLAAGFGANAGRAKLWLLKRTLLPLTAWAFGVTASIDTILSFLR